MNELNAISSSKGNLNGLHKSYSGLNLQKGLNTMNHSQKIKSSNKYNNYDEIYQKINLIHYT